MPNVRAYSRAGGDRLDILAARLAQVAVHIDESGRDHLPRAVDHRRVLRSRDVPADALDLAIAHEQVADAVELRRRIDQPAALEQHVAMRAHAAPFAASASWGELPESR